MNELASSVAKVLKYECVILKINVGDVHFGSTSRTKFWVSELRCCCSASCPPCGIHAVYMRAPKV